MSDIRLPLKGWIERNKIIASNDASIDIPIDTDKPTMIRYRGLIPVVDGADIHANISNDGGSTFKSGATDYCYCAEGRRSDGNTIQTNSISDSKIKLSPATGIENGSGETCNGWIIIENPSDPILNLVRFGTYFTAATLSLIMEGNGFYKTNSIIDAIQISLHNGNISEGEFTTYVLE